MRPDKPPYGSPCNSCGLCCENELCPLGQIVFPRAQAPCPALESDGDLRVCGLIANPATYAPIRVAVNGADAMLDAAKRGIGAGLGCDARLFGEESNPPAEFVRALREFARNAPRERRGILRLWSNPR